MPPRDAGDPEYSHQMRPMIVIHPNSAARHDQQRRCADRCWSQMSSTTDPIRISDPDREREDVADLGIPRDQAEDRASRQGPLVRHDLFDEIGRQHARAGIDGLAVVLVEDRDLVAVGRGVRLAAAADSMPKPGISPVPWPCTPYFLPCSEPTDTKSIWSWIGLMHGACRRRRRRRGGGGDVVVVVVVVDGPRGERSPCPRPSADTRSAMC